MSNDSFRPHNFDALVIIFDSLAKSKHYTLAT
jgi:hypothetical protein